MPRSTEKPDRPLSQAEIAAAASGVRAIGSELPKGKGFPQYGRIRGRYSA